MNLLDYNNKLYEIKNQNDLTYIEKDYKLIKLTNKLTNQYKIPLFINKRYKSNHLEIVKLYNQIYLYRSQLYKPKFLSKNKN